MRTLVVTGATGGLGEFVARRLLARGDNLVLTGRDGERLHALQSELASDGEVEAVVADVSQPDGAEEAAGRARERFGQVDGLVALAGTFRAGTPVIFAERELYLELYEANVLSAAMASRAVLRQLTGPGWFVYVSSLLAVQPMPAMGPYAASKSALMAWAQSFSREIQQRGSHANVILTTLIDTPKNRADHPGADYSLWAPAERIADVVAFLTSDDAGAMYGGVIPVSGLFSLMPALGALGHVGGPPPGMPPGAGPPGGGPPPGMPPGAGPPGGGPPTSGPRRYALLYPFKPGSTDEAVKVFQEGGDPPQRPGGQIKLISTTVFRKDDTVIRLFEIDGDLEEAIDQLVQAAELGDVGRQLQPLLDESVDLTSHEGLRHFFETQMMELLTHREVPPWVRAGASGPPPA